MAINLFGNIGCPERLFEMLNSYSKENEVSINDCFHALFFIFLFRLDQYTFNSEIVPLLDQALQIITSRPEMFNGLSKNS